MRLTSLPTLRTLFLAILGLGVAGSAARADLVWNPQTGWSIQGGALTGLVGADGPTALNQMNAARREEDAGRLLKAIHAYTRITKKYGSSIYAAEAYYRIGHLRLDRKQYYKAFEAFQVEIARYPNESRFNELIGEEYRIASFLLDGGRNHIWGLIPGPRSRERALTYLAAVALNAPYSDYAPLALMALARGEEQLRNTDDAIDALDQMVNTYQQSVLVPSAYLELARAHASLVQGAYYDQAETREAITYYEDFMILFPGDPNIGKAAQGLDAMKKILADSKIKIGDFYFFKRDNYTAARVFYNEAITAYPDSEAANQAKKKLVAVEAKAAATLAPGGSVTKKHFLFF
jgi:outer membrane protein assembly factor BamD